MRSQPRAADVPSGLENLHHEGPAIDTLRTLLSAAVIIAMVVLSGVASRAIYTAMLRPSSDRSLTPLHGEGLILPPQPRLEGIEMMSAARAATSAANDDRLQKYGWMNREKKIVHIPIQQAMDLAIQRSWFRGAASTRNEPPTHADTSKTSAENNSAR